MGSAALHTPIASHRRRRRRRHRWPVVLISFLFQKAEILIVSCRQNGTHGLHFRDRSHAGGSVQSTADPPGIR